MLNNQPMRCCTLSKWRKRRPWRSFSGGLGILSSHCCNESFAKWMFLSFSMYSHLQAVGSAPRSSCFTLCQISLCNSCIFPRKVPRGSFLLVSKRLIVITLGVIGCAQTISIVLVPKFGLFSVPEPPHFSYKSQLQIFKQNVYTYANFQSIA